MPAIAADTTESRMQAASWGDDYELLFAAGPDVQIPIAATLIGRVIADAGLALTDGNKQVPLPPSLGYQHQ